jgi:polar amino acid transport system ATP-binding protein
MSILRAFDVTKWYGDLEVLRGVTFEVEPGQVKVIIGPSGSGKSTLLRCLALLEEPDRGEVSLEDRRPQPGEVGMVFQGFNLFQNMTALQNVMCGLVEVRGLSKKDAREQATEFLARVGLADRAAQYPDELSGGQQQRVAIVRALAMRPRVMLLDEITAALDPELVGDVLEIVRELAQGGLTMLLATHEMGFAKEVASQVCFLDAGSILERGPAQQIFEDPKEPRTQQFLSRVVKSGRL